MKNGYNNMGKSDQAKEQMENAKGWIHTAVRETEIACKAKQGKTTIVNIQSNTRNTLLSSVDSRHVFHSDENILKQLHYSKKDTAIFSR